MGKKNISFEDILERHIFNAIDEIKDNNISFNITQFKSIVNSSINQKLKGHDKDLSYEVKSKFSGSFTSLFKRIEDAIEVVEWAIDHRQAMLKDNDLLDREHYRLNLNEIHQLRQGKAYLELITDMLYGTSELLEIDQEIAEDN